jgi:hypothetical protein
MRDERGPWYLLTGLIIGIVLGLLYAWLISPREYKDTSPASLQSEFKDQYRAMIAAAFVANGNLARAKARLELLGDSDVVRALAEQAQRTLAEGESPREAQALGLLAVALGQGDSSVTQSPIPTEASTQNHSPNSAQSITPTPPPLAETLGPTHQNIEESPSPTTTDETSQVTRTSNSTFTPLPTRTPTEMVESTYVLQESTFVCDKNITGPLIQILAEDSTGRPLSREGVIVTWDEGEDHFYTGLKPELGRGYADFLMIPGIVYEIRMASGGQTVSDITPAECETQGGRRYWGSWLLIFTRP